MTRISAFDISAQALSVNKTKMDIVSQNIANAETIQTDTEQPYQRRVVSVEREKVFTSIFDEVRREYDIVGIQISEIAEDESPFKLVYDPDNPYANEEGYILKSNVNTTQEMLDLLQISRSYEANLTAFNSTKDLIVKTLRVAD